MKIYLQNGTTKEVSIFSETNQSRFYILFPRDDLTDYIYPGHDLVEEIQSKLVLIHSLVDDVYISDYDNWSRELSNVPIVLCSAGLGSILGINDDGMTRDHVEKFYNDFRETPEYAYWRSIIPDLNKILFLNDTHAMIHSLQNIIEAFDMSLVDIYLTLVESVNLTERNNSGDGEYRVSSAGARKVSYAIENYFIKANAILDYFCKICLELQHYYDDFSKIPKLVSRNKTYGNRKSIQILQKSNTIFEYDEIIKLIVNIRNQVIHNGSLDSTPVIFYRQKENEIIERYALFPDTTSGQLDTWINRNKFYGKYTKVNDVLPDIHRKFCQKILHTIECILKNNGKS
uniref:hypothetical protein n=1 Tax=Dialister sp. TaxID=1955814 RepID=UPI004028BEB6